MSHLGHFCQHKLILTFLYIKLEQPLPFNLVSVARHFQMLLNVVLGHAFPRRDIFAEVGNTTV